MKPGGFDPELMRAWLPIAAIIGMVMVALHFISASDVPHG